MGIKSRQIFEISSPEGLKCLASESDLFCGHQEPLKVFGQRTAWLEQRIQRSDLQAYGWKDKI